LLLSRQRAGHGSQTSADFNGESIQLEAAGSTPAAFFWLTAGGLLWLGS
jgi:hypothetical protein